MHFSYQFLREENCNILKVSIQIFSLCSRLVRQLVPITRALFPISDVRAKHGSEFSYKQSRELFVDHLIGRKPNGRDIQPVYAAIS